MKPSALLGGIYGTSSARPPVTTAVAKLGSFTNRGWGALVAGGWLHRHGRPCQASVGIVHDAQRQLLVEITRRRGRETHRDELDLAWGDPGDPDPQKWLGWAKLGKLKSHFLRTKEGLKEGFNNNLLFLFISIVAG